MSKKTKSKKRSEPKPKPPERPKDSESSPFDENGYGGLPERDLKKNLGGCG